MKKIVLFLGGARSGKSRYALEYARRKAANVLFVATATAGDEEMRQRIEAHKKERPGGWRTLEAYEKVAAQIEANAGGADLIIIDCVTLLVNNVFCRFDINRFDTVVEDVLEKEVMEEIGHLLETFEKVPASFLIVSNEVGFGVVPETRMGRLYRDLLGKANQILASSADEVYCFVAGIPLQVKPNSAGP